MTMMTITTTPKRATKSLQNGIIKLEKIANQIMNVVSEGIANLDGTVRIMSATNIIKFIKRGSL